MGWGLSATRAASTGNGLEDFRLFTGTGVLDKMPDVDDALVAGVGTLEAGVVRLYSIVLILGGWVRVGCARLLCGHEAFPFVVRASGSCGDSAGAVIFTPT
jgi:hypothetical protein